MVQLSLLIIHKFYPFLMIESGNAYVTNRGRNLTIFYSAFMQYDIMTYKHYTGAHVLGFCSAVNWKVNQLLDVIIFTPCEKLKNLVKMYVDVGQGT